MHTGLLGTSATLICRLSKLAWVLQTHGGNSNDAFWMAEPAEWRLRPYHPCAQAQVVSQRWHTPPGVEAASGARGQGSTPRWPGHHQESAPQSIWSDPDPLLSECAAVVAYTAHLPFPPCLHQPETLESASSFLR